MRKILKKLVGTYGEKILLDNDKLRGMLKDYRIEERKVIQLNTLLQISLFKDIIRNNCSIPQMYRIIKQCQTKTMFPSSDIEDIVNDILYALSREELSPPVPKDYSNTYKSLTVFSFSCVSVILLNITAIILNIYSSVSGVVFCLTVSASFIANDVYFYFKKKDSHTCRETVYVRIDSQLVYLTFVFIVFAYLKK